MLEETDKKGKRPGMVAVLNCEVLKTVYLKLKNLGVFAMTSYSCDLATTVNK